MNSRQKSAIVAALALLVPCGLAQAQQAVLQISGIAGDSRIEGYSGAVDVLRFTLSQSRAGASALADLAPVVISRRFDRATHPLAGALFEGNAFTDWKLSVLRFDGNGGVGVEMTLELCDVALTQLYQGGSTQGAPQEQWTFAYGGYRLGVPRFDERGRPTGETDYTEALPGEASCSLPPIQQPDRDNDGVPDDSDDFPDNAAASVDSDGDGYPDAWNAGCDSACQATSGLTLDAFPNNASAAIDTDSDGLPDSCIGACTGGLTLDDDPNVAQQVCGNPTAVTANQWKMVGISCDLRSNNTLADAFGPSLGDANYLVTWVAWRWDALLAAYGRLSLTDTLHTGDGIWIFSTVNSALKVEAVGRRKTASNAATLPMPGKPAYGIDLVGPVSEADGSSFNFVGMPIEESVRWADVRFQGSEAGTPFDRSIEEAEASTGVNPVFYIWDVSSYRSYNGTTPGMEGTANAYDGFWIELLWPGFQVMDGKIVFTLPSP
jgi:type VI protein secretion system component Hcp